MKAESKKTDIKRLFEHYYDLFQDKLPPVLPPKRADEFQIKLWEGSEPQKKRLYRMSTSELNEPKK